MKRIFTAVKYYLLTTDLLLISVALGISVLSVILLLGIENMEYFVIGMGVVKTQAAAVAIGIIGAVIASCIDYKQIAKLWKLYAPPIILLMLLTYTSMGIRREGSSNKSWLNLMGVSIQPSEFLKIVVIITLAMHIAKVKDDMNKPKTIMMLLIHAFLPVGMVLLQKDWGVASVMLIIVCAILYIGGLSTKMVLTAIISAAAITPIVWFYLLDDYHKNRFMVVLDPTLDPLGTGYQQLRGITSMGVGQLMGIGIFSDSHRYVPEMYNDFIFTFLGESLGFIGTSLLLVAYLVLFGCIFSTALRCKDTMGKLICVGVLAMISSQVIINIGMCLMVTPVVGVTLPLLSAGGSSVITVYAALGLVLSVHSSLKEGMMFSPKNELRR